MYSLKVIDLEYIQYLCKQGKIRWTNHILIRILQRGIKQVDIENAILTGKIIEHYPDDYPHPSCLILSLALDTKEIHVVCGIANDELYMITAYRPDSNKWDKNFSERKRT